jgi:uncharacterized protein YgbK (DUF1537 family)
MDIKPESGREYRRSPLLGCIADDFTGATDLAGILTLNGMRTTVELGLPESTPANVDAMVIALKSRSAPVNLAVESSLAVLRWLRDQGCRRFFFKYCSTFDSTPRGNIGPVAEALMDELGVDFTIVCPALPENGRTVYNGYLFVGSALLEETSMRSHPLTPMTDSNLVRLLQAQCKTKVGLIEQRTVHEGSKAISQSIEEARTAGIGLAIVDATSESDLRQIALACEGLVLWTGASGLAIGIAHLFRSRGLLDSSINANTLPRVSGFSAVLSGSCSQTTQRQVAWMEKRVPTLRLDPLSLATDPDAAIKAAAWARSNMSETPILISATGSPDAVQAVQETLGAVNAGRLVESCLAEIARLLVASGVRRLIVAGGETSGAVVAALGIRRLRMGPHIDPGVHWAVSESEPHLALALKSGNFGSEDFFEKAWTVLP